jgi:hypothetical protein
VIVAGRSLEGALLRYGHDWERDRVDIGDVQGYLATGEVTNELRLSLA